MRSSTLFGRTLREAPSEAEHAGFQLVLRAGLAQQLQAGSFALLPLGMAVLRRMENIMHQELAAIEAQEFRTPIVQTSATWQQTGRYEQYGPLMLRMNDRAGRRLLLAPTHEEAVADMALRQIESYRQLPQIIYQIHTKYRDEARAKGGLMRLREFTMLDAYSLAANWQQLDQQYDALALAFERIFGRCGLQVVAVEASAGEMGGAAPREYMALSASGEDTLALCDACGYAANLEVATGVENADAGDLAMIRGSCTRCGSSLRFERGVEVGHIFKLGTRYTAALGAMFLDQDNTEQPIVMGSYGIGLERMLQVLVEQHHDERGIIWPRSIAPFDLHLLQLGQSDALNAAADTLYAELAHIGLRVLFDERPETAGVKFNDADLLGLPLRLVISQRLLAQGHIELKTCRGEATIIERAVLADTVQTILTTTVDQ